MIRCGGVLLALSLSCAANPPPRVETPSSPASPGGASAASAADASAAAQGSPRERPELGQAFAAERVQGTIALFDSADGVLTCSDVARCKKAVVPASTFKIANSMIALETAVMNDAESPLPWDGKQYTAPDWNQDHTLRTAMRVSCLPCFQGIARKVGQERMADWVSRLQYGNRDISGGIDRFWIWGGMRISPLEQVDFLRRFEAGKLPISARTAEIVRDILTLDVGPEHVLLGKTGMATPPDAPGMAAWFVGWVEVGKRRVFFATLIDEAPLGIDVMPIRRRVTEKILGDLGVLPRDRTRETPGKERL